MLRSFTVAWLLTCALLTAAAAADKAVRIDFSRDIRPLLSDHCFQCHGTDAESRQADLRLDQKDGLFSQRADGAIVVPGQAAASLLMHRITAADDTVMPPAELGKPLSDSQRDLLRRWIDEGAVWHGHWAFEPIRKPELPPIDSSATPRHPIDAFVQSELHQHGLEPASIADSSTRLRRLTLDLTGLPPTPEEVQVFAADSAPDAWRQLVDRLLKSPRYGEHMAVEWLDAARYADSDGYESDPMRTMWPWRDWVIDAFNHNMPFDQFLTEQLAGDLLPDSTLKTRLATGFNRNHRLNNEGGILPEEWIVEYVCDRTETTATVFMGLTWGCARCHDHKFDPITQRDYYRLFAYFNRMDEKGSARGDSDAEPMLAVSSVEHLDELAALNQQCDPLEQQLEARNTAQDFEAAWRDWLAALQDPAQEDLPASFPATLRESPVSNWDDKRKAAARRHFLTQVDPEGSAIEAQLAPVRQQRDQLLQTGARVMVMQDAAAPRDSFILTRGQYNMPADRVDAGTPDWLPPPDPGLPHNRLGLARWLTAPEHPLTARVVVNRTWQHFFGTGLVKTQEDFGSQGELPSHPELLDWLAASFVESGWDLHWLIRTIVTSHTYQQSSVHGNLQAQQIDPGNRLLWRGNRGRLSAGVIRDQALSLAGLLVTDAGGPPVYPYQPDGLWQEIIKGGPRYETGSGAQLYRRSVYTLWRRAVKPPLMMLLDSNERDTCRVSQRRTNTPLQALLLLNDMTFVETARCMAARVLREGGTDDPSRLQYAFVLATGRHPSEQEREILLKALSNFERRYAEDPAAAGELILIGQSEIGRDLPGPHLAAWTAIARILLNLDEVMTQH